MKLKALFAGLLAFSLFGLSALPSAQAGIAPPSTVPNLGLYAVENFQLGTMPSQLYAVGNQADATTYLMCKTESDARCVAARQVFGIGGLDVCAPSTKLSCIEAAWAVDPKGTKIDAQFVKNVQELVSPAGFNEIPEVKMSGSHSMGAIWKFPGVNNSAGSDEYFVAVENRIWANKGAGTDLSSGKFGEESFISGIIPIKEVAGSYAVRKANDIETGNGAWGSNTFGMHETPAGEECAITDATYCGVRAQFPEGFRFGMTLHIANLPTGWFSGRLGLPVISTAKKGLVDVISIEAEPLTVPNLDFVVPNAEIPEEARKLAFDGTQWGRGGWKEWQILSDPTDPKFMSLLLAFAPAYKNKASSSNSTWSFKTMLSDNGARDVINKCSSTIGSFGGLVTSNAMTYSSGPPTYDASTGALNYKVASPHFEANGKVALGTYDLAIRSSVVRCIYNFSNAPIQATISIVSEDGENKVATTVVNEHDGWLYLSAKGYTFSSPTISVKMTQKAESPTQSASSEPISKKTITCSKGKVNKKVTAVSPVCPSGYKKAKS